MSSTTNRNYRYTLHLSQKISGGDAVPLDLTQYRAVEVKLEGVDYKITFTGLRFFRKIYQPGAVEAELQFVPKTTTASSTPADVANMLMYRLVRLTITDSSDDESTAPVSPDNESTIADNYFVYQVKPQYEMQTAGQPLLFVKLSIYSMDKLMTMSKYSKAYLSQKLGNILKNESKLFKFGDSSMLYTDTSGIRKLVYDFKGAKTEFIQPYLVQYNESFYDFMVRVSNRCGEFFYFEDGRCYLGLPEKPIRTIKRYNKITYQQQTVTPFNVSDYGRDSVKDGNGMISGNRLNGDPLCDRDKKYPFPKDVFPQNLSYNAEVVPDEFFMPLFKGQFTNLLHEEFLDGVSAADVVANTGKHLFPIVEHVLRYNGTASELVGAIAGAEAPMAISAGLAVMSGEGDNQFINSVKEGTDGQEKCDGKQALQFAGYDTKSWANLRYHADVKKYEEEQQQKIVCVDLGTTWENIRLGDRVRLGTAPQVYIVIQIKLVADEKWAHDYRGYDEVDMYSPLTPEKTRQSMVFYAIPAVDTEGTNVFPPVHAGGAFRQSDSQNAFVVDNKDPKKQGRVRIIFPWQAKNVQLQNSYQEARVEVEKVEQERIKYEADINNLQDILKEMNDKISFLVSVKNTVTGIFKLDSSNSTAAKRVEIYKKEVQKLLVQKTDELQKAKQEEASYMTTLRKKKEEKVRLEGNPKASIADVSKLNVEIMQLEENHRNYASRIKKLEDEQEQLKNLKAVANSQSDMEKYVKDKKKETDEAKKKLKEKKDEIASKLKVVKQKQETAQKELDDKSKELKDDRLAVSTPWVRVTTPLATEGGGTMFKLMEGDEVMVDFENGNVERPYVVGSVYSKDTVSPIYDFDRSATPSLSKNPSIVMESSGGHAITFKDGGSVVEFLASFIPGLSIWLPSVAGKVLGKNFDWGKSLTGGIRIADKYGMYSVDLSSTNRKVSIRSGMGNVDIDAFTGITIKAPNGNISIEGKNIDIKAYNRLSMTSGLNIKDKEQLKDDEGLWKVGNFFKDKLFTAAPAAVMKVVGGGQIDLTFIRTMLEVFLKPVDGTMYIKSKRYMLLEAGTGQVQVDKDRYKKEKADEMTFNQTVYDKIKTSIETISTQIDNSYQVLLQMKELCNVQTLWMVYQDQYLKQPYDIIRIAYEGNVQAISKENLDNKFKDDVSEVERARVLNDANDYLAEARQCYDFFSRTGTRNRQTALGQLLSESTYWDELKAVLDDFNVSITSDIGENCGTADTLLGRFYGQPEQDFNTKKQKDKRIAVAKFLDKIKTKEDVKKVFNFGVRTDYMNFINKNYEWTKFINSLDVQTNGGAIKGWFYEILVKPLADAYKKQIKEGFGRTLSYDNVWNEAKGGQILFSDNSNNTYHIGEDTAHNNKPSLMAQSGTNYKKDLWGDLKKLMILLK